MRLRFLGTGPAVGIPREGHDDPACRDARNGGKSRRTRSAAILTAKGTRLLFDAGPDIEGQLDAAKAGKLDAVFLTHGHSDASSGLRDLNHWLSRQPHRYKLPIITDQITQQKLAKANGVFSCLQWVIVKPFDTVKIGDLNVRCFPVAHSLTPGFPTMGFLVDNRLAYASDVADIPTASAKLLRGVPTLVLDGAMWFGNRMAAHLTTDQAVAWGYRLNVDHLVLTQIGHSYPPHDEAMRSVDAYLQELQLKTPRRVTLAFDGMVLNG